MSIYFDDSMIWMYRSGKDDDPFVPIQQTLKINDGTILLEEIPDDFQRPVISHSSKQFCEVLQGDPDENSYKVIYKHGIIVFNHVNNGDEVVVNYYGTGKFFLPAERIYLKTDQNGEIAKTLKDFVDDVESRLQSLEHEL